ncbi:hypothetical protein SPRG_14164 [Saprolegnia parasitica CBS 223.65]|uniref:RING-type domain-containing protein n=1 Tax=Saprolegnia parasitica (strain CBS 223.65) TaxID=695850 RepID=A0A067C0B5_SAPPC|nr:hypothetical protein SPRG_14164 [Saprolegnia parasitica CBS 223.65]KDO20016.1 hypothetical protein SPRG_14164 [Saprolegnia parasitica CBS 223.65]|eukprot:XP_012209252.1 hypothetical protein SPRG_14164 [Saprolegnia parasitica CBS 223.65]
MVAPGIPTCQVCFDEADAVVTQICRTACPAVLCTSCVEAFLNVQAESALYGVLAKLKCPICIRPTNLVRWRERLGKAAKLLEPFETKVLSACDVKCPNCHNNSSMLPAQRDSVKPLTLPTHLAQQVPELQTRCGQYCRHRLSVDALYDYVCATFPGHDDVILTAMLPLIHDVERRATLFLRWRRDAPFIQSPCCKADLCFACKVGGHHLGQPCAPVEAIDDIAQCPSCKLHLVKGDGCDSMNCFCGMYFSWSSERMAFQFQCVRPEVLSKLRILVRRHKPRLCWSVVQRHLPGSEWFYRLHLAEHQRLASSNTLAPWLGGNGIELGMSMEALAALKPDLWTADDFFKDAPVAPEVLNFTCRYVWVSLDQVADLFPSLPPTATYDGGSYACFMFDATNALRLVSLRFYPQYMHQWKSPDSAPLLGYFSTLLGGTNQDTLVDHGHTVVSVQDLEGMPHLEFVDVRAPPEINGRAFTPYLKDQRLRDVILPACKRPDVRRAMRAVQRHLRTAVWKRKWGYVMAEVEAADVAARAKVFWANYWATLPADDKDALIEDMNSVFAMEFDD